MSDESAFWQFSLAVYGQPGVAEVCLLLQDDHGADVNVVLFLLWRAAGGREATPEELKVAMSAVAPWQERVVRPLREIRRWLKIGGLSGGPGGAPGGFSDEKFRKRVKEMELEAERLQQEWLAALPDSGGRGETDFHTTARSALEMYAAALQAKFPDAVVRILVAAAASLEPE